MSDVTTTVVGNLVSDPEVRFFDSGDAYCNITVAVGSRKKDADGNWVDGNTSYFDVQVIGSHATNLADSLVKGQRVIVTGSQTSRAYEDKEGVKRTAYSIRATAIGPDLRWATAQVTKSVGNRNEGGSAPAPASRQAPAQSSFDSDEEPF